MAYLLNEEGMGLVEMIRDFGEQELKDQVAEYDKKGEYPEELVAMGMEMGLHLLEVPAEFGGPGLDYRTLAAVYEELAKYDAGYSTTFSASGLGMKPVLIAGSKEQQEDFFKKINEGNIAAFCLTEPNAGSDAGAGQATAVLEGDEYVINGRKTFITNGGVAGIYTVFALTDKSKGVKGMSAFIVDRNTPGVSIGKEEDKMGIRLSNTTDVIFDNVRIPKENLLGKEGQGFGIAMKTLDLARPYIGAIAVGIAQRGLEESIKYAKERVQFGRPIASLQAIQFKIADMKIKTETARQMVAHTFDLVEAGKPYTVEAAIAKAYAGDIAMEVASESIQVLAGYGYSREYPVEKLLRDAKIFQIFEGTNEIQRVVIAGNLLR